MKKSKYYIHCRVKDSQGKGPNKAQVEGYVYALALPGWKEPVMLGFHKAKRKAGGITWRCTHLKTGLGMNGGWPMETRKESLRYVSVKLATLRGGEAKFLDLVKRQDPELDKLKEVEAPETV